jgi:hypothetical protein
MEPIRSDFKGAYVISLDFWNRLVTQASWFVTRHYILEIALNHDALKSSLFIASALFISEMSPAADATQTPEGTSHTHDSHI